MGNTPKQNHLYLAFALRRLARELDALHVEFLVSPISGISINHQTSWNPVSIHEFDESEEDGSVWHHIDGDQLRTAAAVIQQKAEFMGPDMQEPINPLDQDVDDDLGRFSQEDKNE